jgi:hypothetical protein
LQIKRLRHQGVHASRAALAALAGASPLNLISACGIDLSYFNVLYLYELLVAVGYIVYNLYISNEVP